MMLKSRFGKTPHNENRASSARLLQFFDLYVGIVVGHAARRIRDAPGDQDIALWPVNLQVSASDWCEEHIAFEAASLIGERNAGLLGQLELGRVIGIHENSVPRSAVNGINFRIDERVKLFAPAGRHDKPLAPTRATGLTIAGRWTLWPGLWTLGLGLSTLERNSAEVGFAVRRREPPVRAKVRATVLNGIAGLLQVLDSIIKGHDPGDFLAQPLTRLPTQQVGALRKGSSGHFAKDLPFGHRA